MLQRDRFCLIFGIIAGGAFLGVPTVLGALLPHYNPIAQTISEIGEKGSLFEATFKAFFLVVAISLVLFSYGVYRFSSQRRLSPIPAVILGFFAATELGVAIFESPNPLHNVFGISSMLGFLAPLALAITWPRTSDQRTLRLVSGVAAVLVLVAVALNLMPLFVQPEYLREHYGLVQRALFLVFYSWCIYLALILFTSARNPAVYNPV